MVRIPDINWFLEEYKKIESGIRDKDPNYYWWIPLDRPILAACKNQPHNSDYCEVYAKVALVNRMYSALLGKGKVPKYEAEDKVAQALCGSDIDNFIEPLFGYDTLTEAILPQVEKCHERLVEIIRLVLGNYSLSFSSKYLSFHVPKVVPIFDSKAVTVSKQILKGISRFQGYTAYETHCRRILRLITILAEKEIKPDVKIIDYVLYSGPST